MKSLFLLVICVYFSAGYCQIDSTYSYIPIDSAGYFTLIDSTGIKKADWIKANSVKRLEFSEVFYKVKQEQKLGVFDAFLNSVIPSQFDQIQVEQQHFFCKKKDELVIFDFDFKIVKTIENCLALQFEKTMSNPYNRIIVETDLGFGILESDFEWLVKPSYDQAFFMSNIIYTRKDSLFGFIASEKVHDPRWLAIGDFNALVVEVWNNTKHRSYFLRTGQMIPDSDSTLVYDRFYQTYKIYKNGKAYLFDNNLKPLLSNYQGVDIFMIDRNANADISKRMLFAVKNNDKIGAISQSGSRILPPVYDHVSVLLAHTTDNTMFFRVMENGKFGVVNSTNKTIIPSDFTYLKALGFNNDIKVFKSNKIGVMNTRGDTIIPIMYTDVNLRNEGYITKVNGKYGFYNRQGEEILMPIYSKVINSNGGLEYINRNRRCMVGKHGLMTPLNCSKITKGNNLIKYYIGNKIVLHNLKDDQILDTTVYENKRSINLDKNHANIRRLDFSESNGVQFINQLNGKIGAINKKGNGYLIEPYFFNVFSGHLHTVVKLKKEELIDLDSTGVEIRTKEHLFHFYDSNGSLGEELYSVNATDKYSNGHSSNYDGVMNNKKKWTYRPQNNFYDDVKYILPRQNQYSVALKDGKLNFIDGQELMPFKTYYTNANSFFNFMVISATQFDRLANNPMIKVKDPKWTVYEFNKGPNETRHDDYLLFDNSGSGTTIFQGYSGGIGLLAPSRKIIIEPKADDIKKVEQNQSIFYIANFRDTDSKKGAYCKLYNAKGVLLRDESYINIEVLTSNAFKVRDSSGQSIIDSTGRVIYSISKSIN